MSGWLAPGLAVAYAVGLVGLHRWSMGRRRASANGYAAVGWLDWDVLLGPVTLAEADGGMALGLLPDGGPPPQKLSRFEGAPSERVLALAALVSARGLDAESLLSRGFPPGEAEWLGVLCDLHAKPDFVLEQLRARSAETCHEVYLREALELSHGVTPFTIELAVYASQRRLAAALRRFGNQPALFHARAKASALLGATEAVIDDLGRAVYFSQQSRFAVQTVLASPFIEEARPALWRACVEAKSAVA